MYLPKHFTVSDQQELFAFMRANAFGQLISTVDGRLFSSHIPFLLSEDNSRMMAHLARPNPQLRELAGQEVLITLQGVHDYISPTWYQNPGVPTWNYQVVHIYGRGQLIEDAEAIRSLVNTLSGVYESSMEQPWQPDYKDSMLRGIVGIEIEITEIQGKYKLSQNRPSEDQQQVIRLLRDRGSYQLADEMERQAATAQQETVRDG